MKSLTDSIHALYAAFGKVVKPLKIEACPCCIDKEEIRTLLTKPLRELTGTELSSYSKSAFYTVGEKDDYLFFLPRILELKCFGESGWPDVEIIGAAIGATQPTSWSEERKVALIDVVHASIQEAIDREDGGSAIDSWICAIARMRLDPLPFLEQVRASPEALLSYYEHNSQSLAKQRLSNSFWEKGSPAYETVLAWFKNPEISAKIQAGYGLDAQGSHDDDAPQS